MLERLLGLGLMLLGGIGALLAGYFCLVYYRLVPPDSRRLPAVCRLGEGSCASAIFSRYGRLFGPPNSLFALPFYAAVVAAGFGYFRSGAWPWTGPLLAAAVGALLFGLYLLHALHVRLKTRCPL